MESVTTSYVLGLAAFSASLVIAYFWYDKNKADKLNDITTKNFNDKFINLDRELRLVTNKQTEHDSIFVTDQRVRDIVKDEIKPIKEDLAQVKSNVSQIRSDVGTMMTSVQGLVTEFKVQNALRDYEKTNPK